MSELVDIKSTEFRTAVREEVSDAITGVLHHALKDSPAETAIAVMLYEHICRFERFKGETHQQFSELKEDVGVLKKDVGGLKTQVSALEENMNQQFMNIAKLIKEGQK